ncbi:MAG: hypothetical protein KDA41_02055 [Planctomycetales bacterium]|nr:hypothetical protein [Planctomycetales bacterium]
MVRINWTSFAACLFVAVAARAGEGLGHGHCEHCTPVVQSKTVEKHCWEVRCKEVCIPAVTFPWEVGHGKKGEGVCCWGGRCGKVRTVHHLWQHKYKCEECKCEWNVDGGKCGKAPLTEADAVVDPMEADGLHEAPDVPVPAPPRSADSAPRRLLDLLSR